MEFYFERQLDDLGRIVIPVDIRKILELKPKDKVILKAKDGKLFLEKKI